ncbi:Six-hairpin glycosidase-like protein [Diplogelasinospora grovesii]|uniref:Six-hairpin glycosidase-like protein n=1 Tax=Diplogelasinospora grovesii TaxID=303347 RepID=A0AAN6N6Q1_9PEZI|nr:Six-hairpin glycosidase-like protein [Diplogelasinospora grovesii]
MKLFSPLLLSLSVSACAARSGKPYSTCMIESIISRQQGVVSSGAATSTLESGVLALTLEAWLEQHPVSNANHHNISAYLDSVLRAIIPVFKNNAPATSLLPLDRLSVGQALLSKQHHLATNETTAALSTLNTSLEIQKRNGYGGLWYYVYPNWSYLDGVVSFLPYMAAANWSRADMLNQIQLLHSHCFDRDGSGLLVHGYDASLTAVWANAETGGSPYVWGRSLGWYLAGLVNAFDLLSKQQTNKTDVNTGKLIREIEAQIKKLCGRLVDYADRETGAWWQLPTFPGRQGNFLESSSTALFIFALLKAARLGVVSGDVVAVALRAYNYTVGHFVTRDETDGTLGYNGTVAVCSLNSTATYEYYTSRPIVANSLLGEAAFVLASLEVERLGGYVGASVALET